MRRTMAGVMLLALAALGVSMRPADGTAAFDSGGGVSPRGLGIVRFADTYKTAGGYNRFDYVVVGSGDVKAAGALKASSLLYRGGADVWRADAAGHAAGGVPYRLAAAKGWILEDRGGRRLRVPEFGDWIGDVGDRGYQRAWARRVARFAVAHHIDGIYIDNVVCSVTGLSGGAVPAKYPTDDAWASAYLSFLSRVTPALKRRGLYVVANAYCAGPPDQSANIAWWDRVSAFVDGLLNESFEQNPNNIVERYFDAPSVSWLGHWRANLELIAAAQRRGKAAFALTGGSNADTSLQTYARASYLLVWNGRSGGFVWRPTDAADPWTRAWTVDVGTPLAPMARLGPLYVRRYSRAYVVVNPSLSPVTADVPARWRGRRGARSRRSLTLAPETAAILVRSQR
jgi:hypothetical protein